MSRRPALTARHLVLAVTFLSVFFLMCKSASAQDKTGVDDKIKELKEKRLVLLVKIHEFALKGYQQGDAKFTYAQVHQAQADLLAARLDLAEKKEDRIKICEEAVQNAEAWEKIVEKLVAAGGESGIRTLQAQAYVLETRIALEKAKAAKIQAQPKAPPKDFTNSIGMKFVWISPGNFMMGTPKDEIGRDGERKTQHKVTLTKGFYMGVHHVTQEQWQAVMGNNPSAYKNEKNSPVEQVSWDDCQKFIKKLREKDKKPYRLPTEAEWEYACRAGTTTPFHFGETISIDQVNYNGNYTYGDGKKGKYRQKPTPVGSFPANAWGLHDMHGNLWQWCQDWYGDYPDKDVVDPQGPEKGDLRVLRGGAFNDSPVWCRSASRIWHQPDRPGETIGFRVCFGPD